MAKLICELIGVHDCRLKLYDTKCVITADKTASKTITGNITHGEKTIFLKDIVGVQIKKTDMLIGYLRLETPVTQISNGNNPALSDCTFIYEEEKNGITAQVMDEVYTYIVDRIEELKYGVAAVTSLPTVPAVVPPSAAHSVANSNSSNQTAQTFTWIPVDRTNAVAVGETNIRCKNCQLLQFRRNRTCTRCGARFEKIEK